MDWGNVVRFGFFLFALIAAHLGARDRRKGSHRQRSHGSWSPNNPFESKRAARGRKIASASRSDSNRSERSSTRRSVIEDDDDPFAEDYYGEDEDEQTDEERQQEKYEAQIVRELEREERSRVYSIVQEAGGLQTRDDLREEYREIPNTFKRRDGLPGDEMAEYLATYYPEFGIEDERDLIDFLAA
jgi:hypothetical protein